MHLLWVECRFGLAAAFRHKPGSVGTGRCCNARSRTGFPRLLGGRNDVRLSAEAAALVDPALCVQLLLGRGAYVAEGCCRSPRSARVLALRKRTFGDLSQCTPWPVFGHRAGAAAPACVFLAGYGCLTRTTHVWKMLLVHGLAFHRWELCPRAARGLTWLRWRGRSSARAQRTVAARPDQPVAIAGSRMLPDAGG